LLAHTENLVRQYGAASNYIISKSLPRYVLAIELLAEEAGLKQYDVCNMKQKSFRFHLSSERKGLLKDHAHVSDEEIGAIVKCANGYNGGK